MSGLQQAAPEPETRTGTDSPVVIESWRRQRRGVGWYLRRLWADKVALFAFLFFLCVVGVAVCARWLAPYGAGEGSLIDRLQPIGAPGHPLGTDSLGRDVLSRLIWGAQISLLIGFAVTFVGAIVGVTLGTLAGYYGGRVDTVIMRTLDIQLSFPATLLAFSIILVLGANLRNLIIALAVGAWMSQARLVRGLVLRLRSSPMVESAQAIGAKNFRIMRRHIFPNIASSVLNLFVLDVAEVILAESVISFLGFGVQPPQSSWGLMVASGKDFLATHPHLVLVPGLTIGLTVLALNLMANWILDVLDPLQQKS